MSELNINNKTYITKRWNKDKKPKIIKQVKILGD